MTTSTPSERAIFSTLRQRVDFSLSKDRLLRSADFRRYWFSGVLKSFGEQITNLALPLCAALLLHATPAQMGRLIALQALPFALFGLPAGVWLDRSSKFPILLVCEILYGFVLLSVPLAYWMGWLAMPWLYAVAFLVGTGQVIGGGAEQVFLTYLVGREQLVDAQSKFGATDSASRLIGPGIAGVLVQWLTAPFAMLINAAGFFVSFVNLKRLGVRDPKPAPVDTHPLHDMQDGLAFVWRHPVLRALAWGAGTWHFLFYGFQALQILFATRVLGMAPGALGAAQMLGGVGMLVSSMLMKPLTRRYGIGPTILIGMASTALCFVLTPLIPVALFGSPTASAALYGLTFFAFDCGVMLFFMPYLALRQKVTPDAFLGRMTSTMRFLTVATAPLGALAAGALADAYGIRAGLACIAGGGVLLSLTMSLASPLRTIRA